MTDLRRIVIIGAGECGTRAALALREYGYDGAIDLINGEAVDPYERPPLSKPGPDELILKPIMGSDRLASENITLHCDQRAVQIDRHTKTVKLSNSQNLFYDRLVLATGASPRKLTLDGLEREDVVEGGDAEDAAGRDAQAATDVEQRVAVQVTEQLLCRVQHFEQRVGLMGVPHDGGVEHLQPVVFCSRCSRSPRRGRRRNRWNARGDDAL